MRATKTLLGFLMVGLTTLAGAVELNTDNFYQKTLGKQVFLKFCVPEDARCQRMAPAWEQLSKEYEHSPNELIGEIDCTSKAAKELCEELEVRSYPTLKYGDVSNLKRHKGPRDKYESLKRWAVDKLKPACGVTHRQLCDRTTRKEIRRLEKLSIQELDDAMAALKDYTARKIKEEREFVEGLKQQQEEAETKMEANKREIIDSGLIMMKKVAAARGIKTGKRKKPIDGAEGEESGGGAGEGTCQSNPDAEAEGT